jgi:hypothetical protein
MYGSSLKLTPYIGIVVATVSAVVSIYYHDRSFVSTHKGVIMPKMARRNVYEQWTKANLHR